MAYSRVYHSIKDDPRFERVWPTDQVLAAWLRLLIEADASYPAPASIPRSCKPSPLAVLVDVGLVELLPNDLYRIHGMATEREQRSEAGRVAGLASAAQRLEKGLLNGADHARPTSKEEKEKSKEETRIATVRLESGEFPTFAQALEAVQHGK